MSRRVGRGMLVLLLLAIGLMPSARPAAASDIECFNEVCSRLTFTLTGNGNGSIYTRSSPEGPADNKIDCYWEGGKQSGTCTYQFLVDQMLGTREIYFRVLADGRSYGCIPNCARDQTVTMQLQYGTDTARDYTFELKYPATVTVTKSGSGGGSVESTPARLLCGSVCAVDFGFGLDLTLAATAGANSVFAGWTGPCTGTAQLCTFEVNGDVTVGAIFQLIPVATNTLPPPVTAAPTRTPTITQPPPAVTADPAVSSAPRTADPGSSAGATDGPTGTGAAPTAVVEPVASGTDSPIPSTEPIPVSDRITDLTPIAVAIVIAAVVLAAGFAAAAYLFRRRTSVP